ncbi:MAG: DNA polymerase III subunit delta [Aestuariivirga sp.]|uniref:DNA polymerase III subunit delta n=1 Tax=Aestuariivirga sp. TaxID=2650926 RepID=UPI0025B8504E|nr:DNA polymerase III subunit delta [Aestuariivirga sp.]MCA3561723.1 DNA polymerase III subunit delta [Aestuariivirga sp.]
MTAIKPAGLDAFLRKPDPAIAAILIHGEEGDAVHELAQRAVKKVAGSLDDPFTVAALTDQDVASDPARLIDEVQSISMFGGSKAVWVKGVGEGFLKAALPLLEGKAKGNLVVAEAAALPKNSQLRAQFERSPHALLLPLYEAEASEIAAMVEQLLQKDDLKIGQDALARFIELAGPARGLARREAEKLALYCLGRDRVSVEDVEAICGNDTGSTPDALADAVFGGEVEEADRLFHDLVRGGHDAGRLLGVVHGQALKLAEFRIAIDRGATADQMVKQARPPVFFRRQRLVIAQLRAWGLSDLVTAGSTLSANVLAARQNSELAQAIAGRCLLSLARKGLALRLDR